MRLALAYCQPEKAGVGLQMDKKTAYGAFPAGLPGYLESVDQLHRLAWKSRCRYSFSDPSQCLVHYLSGKI